MSTLSPQPGEQRLGEGLADPAVWSYGLPHEGQPDPRPPGTGRLDHHGDGSQREGGTAADKTGVVGVVLPVEPPVLTPGAARALLRLLCNAAARRRPAPE